MANLYVLNGNLAGTYLKESGVGTDIDPHVPHVILDSGSLTLTWASGTNIGSIALLPGEEHIGEVGGRTVVVGDETTMLYPANAHIANDAVAGTTSNTATAALRSLALARVNAGSGHILRVKLWTDQATCTARFRIRFYTVAQPTGAIVGDDALMTLLYLNKAQEIDFVDLPAMISGGAGSTAAQTRNSDVRIPFACAAGDKNIYYRLETLDAFTPDASQKYYLEVAAELN